MKHAYLLYTGYGKTKLMLDAIVNAKEKPRVLLISTKMIVESSWQQQIDEWYPGQISYEFITGTVKPKDRMTLINKQPDILALSVDMIDWYIKNTVPVKSVRYLKHGPKNIYDHDEIIKRFDLLIIDESSLFKNSQSQRFKAIKIWAHKIEHVFILSATPTPKDIEDLWSQIYLLDGGARLGRSITKFREDYAIAIPMSNGYNRYQYTQQAVNAVLDKVKDIVTSIPEPPTALFPEPVIIKTMLNPDDVTKKLLKEFRQNYIVDLPNREQLIAFSKNQLMIKINQIASGQVYTDTTTVKINDLKFKALLHFINKTPTPILVPYTYVFDLERLQTIPGARVLKTKKDFEDWNNDLIKVGIISPFAAAHGLNLQFSSCQDIIWFSPIWDTEKWIQTNARVCRRGQTRQVNIRVLILRGSFDDEVFSLCQDKFAAQYNNLHKLK